MTKYPWVTPERNPGDYYHNKRSEADAWLELLEHAQKDNMPPTVIKLIKQRLGQARYVGD